MESASVFVRKYSPKRVGPGVLLSVNGDTLYFSERLLQSYAAEVTQIIRVPSSPVRQKATFLSHGREKMK